MMTKEGSDKIVNFMTPRVGVLVFWHIAKCIISWGFTKISWPKGLGSYVKAWPSSHSRIFHSLEMSLLPVKGCKFWPMLGTHGHWQVSVLQCATPIWHGASIYNGHIRGPVTLTPFAKCLAVERSQPVFTTKVCCGWDSNTQPSTYGDNALTHCAIAAVSILWFTMSFDVALFVNLFYHKTQ